MFPQELRGPFHLHRVSVIPVGISNYIQCKMWDEVTYLFPNFSGVTIIVWEWISNLISHDMINYACWD